MLIFIQSIDSACLFCFMTDKDEIPGRNQSTITFCVLIRKNSFYRGFLQNMP